MLVFHPGVKEVGQRRDDKRRRGRTANKTTPKSTDGGRVDPQRYRSTAVETFGFLDFFWMRIFKGSLLICRVPALK